MIRFIDLTDQITEGQKEFAFWCTAKERFLEVFGEQTWESLHDLKEAAKWHNQVANNVDIERCISLIPEDFFK